MWSVRKLGVVWLALWLTVGSAFGGSLTLLGVGSPPTGSGPIVPAKVQGSLHQNGATPSVNVAVTLASTVTSGSMVACVVGLAVPAASTVALTMADDKGNAYTQVDNATGNDFQWSSFYLLNITNTPQTITAAFDAGSSARLFATIICTEFSGVATTAALDGNSINVNQAGVNTTNGITSNAATTTTAGDLIWGAAVNLSGSSTLTKNATWTQDQTSGQDFNTEYLIQNPAGSIAATWTGTTADSFSSLMMAFKHL